MKYEHFTVLDFVRNERFQDWVRNPNEQSDFYWESWTQNHKDKKHLLIEAREILNSISFPAEKAPQAVMDDVFEKVLNNEKPGSMQGSEERVIVKFNIKKAIAIAASLFLIVAFGFVIVNYVQNLPKSNNAILLKEIIKENPVGRKTTFQLADGSEIKLNASSTLRIADDFGIKNREVYLEGEAFFKISKNPQKPFIVHTENVSTLVTGTAFNVNAFRENSSISVAVIEGTVNTIFYHEGGADTITLKMSDMATFDKFENKISKTSYDYIETMGWKDGVIYFKDVSSREAFDYLERWYGVDILVKNQDKILGSFYGEFKNENLENVLTAMSKALQFEYHLNNKTVLVKPIKH